MRTVSTVAMMALLPTLAAGHGYIRSPVSRGFGCHSSSTGLRNSGCGAVQWEPQSVEGPDGSPRYPARGSGGIADGRIASANRPGTWGNLDQQSATRWAKNRVSAGANTISWTFTAPHSTRDFRYWLTKPDWNPNAPLGRDSFEAAPFCTVSLNNAAASTKPDHRCNFPARRGYAVMLGVWDVADTGMSFYNVVDLDFGGGGDVPPTPPATPVPVPRYTPTPRYTPAPRSTPTPRYTPAPRYTPTPRSTPTPPATGRCTTTVRTWGNCHTNRECCEAGSYCAVGHWYSQCRPGGTPATSAPVPAGGQCRGLQVHNWGPCKGLEQCCASGWRCNRQSIWYSQCVPN